MIVLDQFHKMKSKIFIIIGVFLVIFFAIVILITFLSALSTSNISAHGIFAILLGSVFSILIAGVLIGLVFLSHYRGYDNDIIEFDLDQDLKD